MLKQKEEGMRHEIEAFRQLAERKLEDIRRCDSSITEEKQKQWDKERLFLETQLSFV